MNSLTSETFTAAGRDLRAVAYEISEEGRLAAVALADRMTDYALFVPQLALRYVFLLALGLVALAVFGLLLGAYALLVVAKTAADSILAQMDAEPGDEPFGALMEEIRAAAARPGLVAAAATAPAANPVASPVASPAASPVATPVLIPAAESSIVPLSIVPPSIVLDMTPVIYPALPQKLAEESAALEKELAEELAQAGKEANEKAPAKRASKKAAGKAPGKTSGKSARYSPGQMEAAVAEVLNGASSLEAAARHGVPASTLRKHAAKRAKEVNG